MQVSQEKQCFMGFVFSMTEASITCLKSIICAFMCNMLKSHVILVDPAYSAQKVLVYHAVYLINILLI